MKTQESLAHRSRMMRFGAVTPAAAVELLAGCGDKKEKGASQSAAKVDKQEMTVRQINSALQHQHNFRPEQADAASTQILERLIDQELAFQKADDLKIDRDPRVVQQFEAARREIIVRACFERVGEAAPKPTTDEIRKYYQNKPALFGERRIFDLQEIAIEAKPEQGVQVREKLGTAKSIQEFNDFMRTNDFRFAGNQAVRSAEQLPLASLNTFAPLKDGHALINLSTIGFQITVLAGSRSQPVTEEQGRPPFEQFILNKGKSKLVKDDVKRTRSNVEYGGKLAPGPGAAGATGAASAAVGAEAAAPAAPAPAPVAARRCQRSPEPGRRDARPGHQVIRSKSRCPRSEEAAA